MSLDFPKEQYIIYSLHLEKVCEMVFMTELKYRFASSAQLSE